MMIRSQLNHLARLFLALSASVSVSFAQGGDECLNATPIVGAGPHAIDVTSATASGASYPSCWFGVDVWFEWTAPSTEPFAVLPAASGGSWWSIAVLDGCGGNLIECRRSQNVPNPERVIFDAVQGATYIFRIQPSLSVPVTSFTVDAVPTVSNTTCAQALSISGDGLFAYDPGSVPGPFGAAPEVWYRWTAPREGIAFMGIRGRVVVYDQCGGAALYSHTPVVQGEGFMFRVTAGTEYLLSVMAGVVYQPTVEFTLETRAPVIHPVTGHAYLWMPGPFLWGDARSAAESQVYRGVQGHLVTITSGSEALFVRNNAIPNVRNTGGLVTVSNGGYYGHWTGLFQDTTSPNFNEPAGGWTWVTGEPMTFQAWAQPNRPDNFIGVGGQSEDFMALLWTTFTPWEDWSDRQLPYIVEWDLEPLGAPFCEPTALNSSGDPTLLRANVSNASPVGVRLEANQGPVGQFGFMLVGTAPQDPGVALGAGALCLSLAAATPIGRYSVAGTAFNSIGAFDAYGDFQNSMGTSSTGTGFDVPASLPIAGLPPILPGTTYYFQLWHRDTIGGSNLSNGLALIF